MPLPPSHYWLKLAALLCVCVFCSACSDDNPKPVDGKDARVLPDVVSRDAALPDSGFPKDGSEPDSGENVGLDIGTGIDAGASVYETIVLLDGVPAPDTVVLQGGTEALFRTDSDGRAFVPVDWSMEADIWILASHPRARIWGASVTEGVETPVVINLEEFDSSDNSDYVFSSPGEPGNRPSTAECGHCHQTINDMWFESPHRKTASNPVLQDLYRGSAQAYNTAGECTNAGGRWERGQLPGQTSEDFQCYFDDSVLSALNSNCETPPCGSNLTQFGACADCHAPGINGTLGGRDLRDATEIAYEYGVHCDVCHRTEDIDLSAEPGNAGRLKFLRPSEEASRALGGGGFLPITFGPSHDSPNPRMGSVQRDHFRKAEICAGCHEQEQAVLVPGESIDRIRWPSGKLPIHTTYGEWLAGPLSPGAPCQSCHMPPDPLVSNGADFQRFPIASIGLQGGYIRAPGSVRKHSWVGPRTPSSGVLELAGALFIEHNTIQGTLTATITVKNVGCGHALPTGEPMRSVLVLVEAYCGTNQLPASGGAVVPEFGGWTSRKLAGEDWQVWDNAEIGDVVRVINQSASFYDYEGYGEFGTGRFTPEQKGMPVETYLGEASITAVHSSSVSFTQPLPSGDVAYLVKADAHAGRPGFGFARVTAGASGETMVPHYLATDIVSDNRLMPQKSWSSVHSFQSNCTDPVVKARLVHRAYAYQAAKARGWPISESLMTEAQR